MIKMNDYILRVTAANGSVRGFFATTKNISNESFLIHNTMPVVTAAMGRLLTATSIIGTMLKHEKDLVTVILKGDGPMKGLLATSDSKGFVKGYPYVSDVNIPLKENGKLDVGSAIGFGTLSIIQDMGLKEPYQGQIPLISGEIGDDLTYYFAKSEQTPTSVALGVLVDKDFSVKQSGGFIIQLMPFADEEIGIAIEKKLQTLPPLTSLFEDGKTIEDVANIVLGDLDLEITDTIPIEYYCNCDRNRVEKVLISIGKDELLDILEKEKEAKLNCHFCNKEYIFNENDLRNLIS